MWLAARRAQRHKAHRQTQTQPGRSGTSAVTTARPPPPPPPPPPSLVRRAAPRVHDVKCVPTAAAGRVCANLGARHAEACLRHGRGRHERAVGTAAAEAAWAGGQASVGARLVQHSGEGGQAAEAVERVDVHLEALGEAALRGSGRWWWWCVCEQGGRGEGAADGSRKQRVKVRGREDCRTVSGRVAS